MRWREVDLATQPKGYHIKVKIPQQLHAQTPMSRQWIADRLRSSRVRARRMAELDALSRKSSHAPASPSQSMSVRPLTRH